MNRQEEKRRYSLENKEKLNKQTREWHERNRQRSLYISARNRANYQKVPFDISQEDILIPEVCPVLGIPLVRTKGKRTNNTPSLDRIVPEKGYVKGNIQVISWRANRLKCDASLGELEKIYEYVKKNLTFN